METALRAGYHHIDTAYNYMNEEGVGQGIKNWGGKREDLFVVTKVRTVPLFSSLFRYGIIFMPALFVKIYQPWNLH